MRMLFFIILCCMGCALWAQRVVIDTRHLVTVNENGAARNAAEINQISLLGKVNQSLDNINTNASSVALTQNMIYSSLSNVNSVLKNGLALRDMYRICEEITGYGRQISTLAASEPYLVLFGEQIIRDIGSRSAKMMTEVSGFVLREGENVLMDFNSRDRLLQSMRIDLQIIRGLAYGAWRAMYWAKVRGVIKSLNPFQGFINRDLQIVNDIIRKTNYLKN